MSAQKVVDEQAQCGDGSPTPSGSTENVERIREILFGPQIREYGQRLSRIEERLSHETAELKAEVRRHLDSMEAYTHQEVSDIGDRLRIERGERAELDTRLSRTLADSMKSLERRLIESDERVANTLRDLRQTTFDRMKGVLDDLSEQVRILEASQNRHLEELRNRSLDRLEFASLLTELALRVRGEFAANGLGGSDGGPKP